MEFVIVIEKTRTGFSSYSPDLAGCVATGSTIDEVERNMTDAIEFHLFGMRQEGYAIPHPLALSKLVHVSVSV